MCVRHWNGELVRSSNLVPMVSGLGDTRWRQPRPPGLLGVQNGGSEKNLGTWPIAKPATNLKRSKCPIFLETRDLLSPSRHFERREDPGDEVENGGGVGAILVAQPRDARNEVAARERHLRFGIIWLALAFPTSVSL